MILMFRNLEPGLLLIFPLKVLDKKFLLLRGKMLVKKKIEFRELENRLLYLFLFNFLHLKKFFRVFHLLSDAFLTQ